MLYRLQGEIDFEPMLGCTFSNQFSPEINSFSELFFRPTKFSKSISKVQPSQETTDEMELFFRRFRNILFSSNQLLLMKLF